MTFVGHSQFKHIEDIEVLPPAVGAQKSWIPNSDGRLLPGYKLSPKGFKPYIEPRIDAFMRRILSLCMDSCQLPSS